MFRGVNLVFKMWESGQLERLRIKWWATVKTNCPEEDLTSMDMEQVSAVFIEGEGREQREGRRSERRGRVTCGIVSKLDVAGRSNYLPLFLASLGFDARWCLANAPSVYRVVVWSKEAGGACCSSSWRFGEGPPFDQAITRFIYDLRMVPIERRNMSDLQLLKNVRSELQKV
uniref:Uncharacterized protein n=1 Tax=Timema monikensis TaxID=170555 RepID=A0A7R9HQC7_9NEOP|nr:unnamed protein product [Timema monikensis]